MDMTPEQMNAKMESIMGTFSSVFGANSKSAKALEIAERARIKQIMQIMKVSEDEAKVIASRIKQEEDLAAKEVIRSKAIADAMVKTISGLKQFAEGAISSSQAAYSSTELFTGVAPTLTMLGNVVKSVTDVIATAFSGIPIIGGIVSAADKATAAIVDISIQVMQSQLQNAQAALNTYNAMSKAGASFSGDIEAMRKSAAAAGVNIASYSKFITAASADIVRFGAGLQNGAEMIGKIGFNAAAVDKRLLVMYGSYEGINEAIAGFAAKSAAYGFDVVKNQDLIKKGSIDYLHRLKELTELTGISADRMRKEEDEREQFADYQAALNDLADPTVADRVAQNLSRVGLEFGKEFDKFGAEVFARNGQVISESGLKIEAWSQQASQTVRDLVALSKTKGLSDVEYERRRAEIVTIGQRRLQGEKDALTAVGTFSRATTDEAVGFQNKLAQGLRAGESYRLNAEKTAEEIAKRRLKSPTDATKTVADAMIEANEFKKRMDERVVEQIGNIANLTKKLYEVNDMLVQKFGKDLDKVLIKFDSILDKLLKAAGGEEGGANINPSISAGNAMARNEVQMGRISPEAAKNILGASARDIAAFGGREYLEAIAGGRKDVKPVFPGERAGGQPIDYSGLNIGGRWKGEAVAGGPADQKMIDAARLITQKYPGTVVNAFNDLWHQENAKGSSHTQGKAADLSIPELAGMSKEKREQFVADINKMISGLGKAKYEQKGEGAATGDHVHIEGFKNGGIANRPSIFGEDGYEAAVPLPDGRSIPVSMDNSKLIQKLDELISIQRDHADTSEKIFWQGS